MDEADNAHHHQVYATTSTHRSFWYDIPHPPLPVRRPTRIPSLRRHVIFNRCNELSQFLEDRIGGRAALRTSSWMNKDKTEKASLWDSCKWEKHPKFRAWTGPAQRVWGASSKSTKSVKSRQKADKLSTFFKSRLIFPSYSTSVGKISVNPNFSRKTGLYTPLPCSRFLEEGLSSVRLSVIQWRKFSYFPSLGFSDFLHQVSLQCI